MRSYQVWFVILPAFVFTLQSNYAQYKKADWDKRNTWMNVSDLFELAKIELGGAVADVGCHEGYLTIHMAQKVGDLGKVYAVDVRQDRLDKLDKYLEEHKIQNVKTILGDYDNPKLPKNTLDAVVVMDTYHEMEDYKDILDRIKESLKPGGKILILEKLKRHMIDKPRDEQIEAHTLSLHYVKKELQQAGFLITKEIDDFGQWKNDPDKTMWILVGKRNQ
ncbi:class I SAM-dependent methyltransferase [Aquimarina sediminis]|uniref:class I SAM-dependent methyltransferase n=1 Tax=Aquimarina sediminis TaxID=2070536 RepID=UPI000CA02FC7|nr:class I SAM-dependent methyltransferase [Aquimarina sediminis]